MAHQRITTRRTKVNRSSKGTLQKKPTSKSYKITKTNVNGVKVIKVSAPRKSANRKAKKGVARRK